MPTATKKFLNGRDVFTEYIPDYEKQIQKQDEKRRDPAADAKETASRLLKSFRSKVSPPDDAA